MWCCLCRRQHAKTETLDPSACFRDGINGNLQPFPRAHHSTVPSREWGQHLGSSSMGCGDVSLHPLTLPCPPNLSSPRPDISSTRMTPNVARDGFAKPALRIPMPIPSDRFRTPRGRTAPRTCTTCRDCVISPRKLSTSSYKNCAGSTATMTSRLESGALYAT